ncbi:hypothetical protein E1B28_003351 [Marasmius oreades]|uniref:Uncharacterized protein n=1 Tax=Marasmius oreades TaxID=181124 RepID=A0A9P7RMW4_9AGAR|nr:uncharacterized protein E1B28_003351 [Marasmius oreades]KAG7085813.1 hypothetical protein E1B28_003351 [Marasmius oreades]
MLDNFGIPRSQISPRDRAGSTSDLKLPNAAQVQGPLWFFNALQLIGFTLNLTIILTVALNHKRVRRTTVWYLFMSSWVLWCIAYGLLFILGYQGSQLPPPGLCLFQSALVYALPPFGALLTFGILAQLYCAMHISLHQRRPHKYVNVFITAIPFIVFSAVFIEVIVVILFRVRVSMKQLITLLVTQLGVGDMDSVARNAPQMYCNLKNKTPAKLSALAVGLTSCAMLVLESLVLVTLFRHWDAFVRIREVPGNVLSGTMALRVTVFSFMPMIALLLSVVSVLSTDFSTSAISNVAVAFSLVFGTQKDVISSLIFWRADDKKLENERVAHASSLGVPPIVRKEVFVSEV